MTFCLCFYFFFEGLIELTRKPLGGVFFWRNEDIGRYLTRNGIAELEDRPFLTAKLLS